MRLTVAICTWNRDALLARTLEEITKLIVPPDVWWELLVVNNNCTDTTDEVIASFAERLPIRRLFQPVPGLSNARNLAVSEAKGEYIIWTDDDVLVSPDWLTEYSRAFARHPEAVVFGGPIEPWFPNVPPEWLKRSWPRIANAYASIDYGASEILLTYSKVPFGANIAMRMDAQRTAAYDPARGVTPSSRMGGEETDVVRRFLDDGKTGWWVPGARVRHYIPPDRQTRAYLERWYRGYGEWLGQYTVFDPKPILFGRPRWLWRAAVTAELRYQLKRRIRPSADWVDDLVRARTAWGQMQGYLKRQAHRATESPR